VFKSLNSQVEIMPDRSLLRKIGNGLSYLTPVGARRAYVAGRKNDQSVLVASILPVMSECVKVSNAYDAFSNFINNSLHPIQLLANIGIYLAFSTVQYWGVNVNRYNITLKKLKKEYDKLISEPIDILSQGV
jgi:hypothetical protein